MSRQASTPPRSSRPQGDPDTDTRTIPVVEEEVTVAKETQKTGKAVRVRIAAHQETKRIPVTETVEEVSIERVPVNRYVDERSEPRQEGEVVVVPVFETVAVVEERLLLKEEVRIVRHRREVRREAEVDLRRETPIVERRASDRDEWSQDAQDP